MIRFHLLTEGFVSPNVRALLFPLIVNRRRLRERGIYWRGFSHVEPRLFDCDVLVIESKVHGVRWNRESDRILDEMVDYRRRVGRLVYLDTADSTALLHPEVLPVVDGYGKLQLLRDRSLYGQRHYGNRLFTDYAHRAFGARDAVPSYSTPVDDPDDLAKLQLWWNSSLADYSVIGRYRMEAYARVPFSPFLSFPRWFVGDPEAPRGNQVSCRMGTAFARDSVAWFRRDAQDRLAPWATADRLIYPAYVRELRDSKVVVSPFGWGEINYRDYETFLAGAALLKPDMSHLDTWPDLYRNDETYVAYDWDGETLIDTLRDLLADDDRRVAIARAGQVAYRDHLAGEVAVERFCERLGGLLDSLGTGNGGNDGELA